MSDQPKPQTIGEFIDGLPIGVWVDLPEHGVRIRHTQNPATVDVMPVPVIDWLSKGAEGGNQRRGS